MDHHDKMWESNAPQAAIEESHADRFTGRKRERRGRKEKAEGGFGETSVKE
jgi:hypothetical protein